MTKKHVLSRVCFPSKISNGLSGERSKEYFRFFETSRNYFAKIWVLEVHAFFLDSYGYVKEIFISLV
jgi:hypothetical protein